MQQGIVLRPPTAAPMRRRRATNCNVPECVRLLSFLASGGAPLRTAPLRTGCGVEVIDRLNFNTRYARI